MIRALGIVKVFLIFCVVLFSACVPPLLDDNKVARLNDMIKPVITIISPPVNKKCSRMVEVIIQIKDCRNEAGEAGRVDKIFWEISGEIIVADSLDEHYLKLDKDGKASFVIDTQGINSNFTVAVKATDWNGNESEKSISLSHDEYNGIPSFYAEFSNNTITATWKPVPGISCYCLYYTKDNTLPYEGNGYKVNLGSDITSYVIDHDHFDYDSIHVLRLEAYTKDAEGKSNPLCSSLDCKVLPLSSQSLTPWIITGTDNIRLEWNQIPGVGGYTIYRADENEFKVSYFTKIATINENVFVDTNVNPLVMYYYQIMPVLDGCDVVSNANCGKREPVLSFNYNMDSCSLPGPAANICISGNYAYIACGSGGLMKINTSDMSDRKTICNDYIYNAKIIEIGDNPYIAALGDKNVILIDIANNNNQYPVTDLGPYNLYDIYVVQHESQTYAYIVSSDNGNRGLLSVLDVSSISSIKFISSISIGGEGLGIAGNGNMLYLASGAFGLQIFDITDPLKPRFLSSCSLPGYASGLVLDEDFAYIADGYAGLAVVNVANPSIPYLYGSCDTPGFSSNVFIMGIPVMSGVTRKFIYVADGNGGIQEINILHPQPPFVEQPDFPFIMQSYKYDNCSANSIALSFVNGKIYASIADENNGLLKKEILPIYSRKPAPASVPVLSKCNANDVKIQGNYAYVACDEGIYKLDISYPLSPVRSKYQPTDYLCNSIVVNGDYVYVATTGGLNIFTADLCQVGQQIPLPNDGTSKIIVRGDRVYFASVSGLYLINIQENGNSIVSTKTRLLTDSVYDIKINGNYLYVAKGKKGLDVLDTTKIFAGAQGACRLDEYSIDFILIKDGYLFACDSTPSGSDDAGVNIIDIRDPLTPFYQNPFNMGRFPVNNALLKGKYVYIGLSNGFFSILDISNTNMFQMSIPRTYNLCFTGDDSFKGMDISGEYGYVAAGAGGLIIFNLVQ
jgi:hypothetical protein